MPPSASASEAAGGAHFGPRAGDAAGPVKSAPGARRLRPREVWVRLHLCLALSVGLVFVLAGLTGSVLVFYVEIDRWLNPQLLVDAGAGPRQSHEAVFRALHAAHPARDGSWRLEMPLSDTAPVTARYYRPAETAHRAFAPLMVSVDPVRLEVRASRLWGDTAMTWLYDLHYALLLDRDGRTALGVIGIALMLSLASGVVLWWPRAGRYAGALAFKRRAGSARRTYDLHKLGGIYGVAVLAVVVASGVLLELSQWVNPLIDRASPLFRTPSVQSLGAAGTPRLAVDDAVRVALLNFPGATLRWIETPDGPSGTYRVNLRAGDEPGVRFPRTNVWIDQYSGEVLAIRDRQFNSAGDTLLDWLHPLHNGEAFGMAGRIVVAISGLIPLLLFVTGVMRWQQKRRARRAAPQRPKSGAGRHSGPRGA